MNKITIIGNLGRDPEKHHSNSGQAMTRFSVATNRRYTTAAGEQREEVEWFNCTASGKTAEVCNDYLTKGGKVYIEGRLRSRMYDRQDGAPAVSLDYDRQDGAPAVSLDVFVTELEMLGGPRVQTREQQSYALASSPDGYDASLDDLPF